MSATYNYVTPHPYRLHCPCLYCVLKRDASPGNALMAYQRWIAQADIDTRRKGKGSR